MRLVALVLGLYLAYLVLAFVFQRRLLFPGTFMSPFREVRIDREPGVERVWLQNGEGRSEAWLVRASGPATGASAPALLFLHGNGEFIDDWLTPFRALAARGLHVLLVEYPGYGRSTGRPSTATILEGTTAAYDWLAARDDVDASRIAAMGRSLGGGVAAALATRRPVAALVLQSTFTDVGALALRAYLAPPFLVRDRFPALDALRSWDGPVLVVHGRRDRIIPFSHGEALAGAAAGTARLVALDCGHNDCPPSWEEYRRVVVGFLEESGVLEP